VGRSVQNRRWNAISVVAVRIRHMDDRRGNSGSGPTGGRGSVWVPSFARLLDAFDPGGGDPEFPWSDRLVLGGGGVCVASSPLLDESRIGLGSGRRERSERRMGAMEAPQHDEAALRRLLERARDGDGDAFGTLFRQHSDDVTRLCRRMLDDPAAAEDATSEVFLRARRSLASYQLDKPFRAWLRTIASNHCIDQLRRRRTERQIFAPGDLSSEGLADVGVDVLRRLTQREERGAVVAALDRLPFKYRLPLVLRFYRELDYEAIAEILGVTRGQVGTLLFRAKRHLRERFEEDADLEARPHDPQRPVEPARRRRFRRARSGGAK